MAEMMVDESLMIEVYVPFEYTFNLLPGRKCEIYFQDNKCIEGVINKIIPIKY